MKKKSEAFAIFKKFYKFVTNVFQYSIHILPTENGREYFANDFAQHLSGNDILNQSSCSYTPEQNEMAERKNRHLLEFAPSMLASHVANAF